MNRQEIYERIAKDLLDNDMLDIENYNHDTDELLKDVIRILDKNLENFKLFQGEII